MGKYSFRWGIDILDNGHVPVYRFMLRNYARAGVTRDEFLCIIHLADYHYESPDGIACPSYLSIAEQMGYKHENSIANLTKSLSAKGLLIITKQKGKPSIYDFSPFSQKMLELFMSTLPPHPNVPVPPHPNVPVPPHPNVYEEEVSNNKTEEQNDARPSDEDAPEVTSNHPAIQAYRQEFRKYPRKNTYVHIAARVGESEAELSRWGRVCKWWVLSGYSPVNLAGMLAKYEKVRDGFEPEPPLSGVEDKRLRDRQQSAPRPRVRGKASEDQDVMEYDPYTDTVKRRGK